jgi:hypothetical protein
MPFTPFHFGPGLFIKSIIPNKFGLLPYIFVNVVIDIESLYFIVSQQFPYHRFFHTYLGVTVPILISLSCIFLFARLSRDSLFLGNLPEDFTKTSIISGVLIGSAILFLIVLCIMTLNLLGHLLQRIIYIK